VPPAARAGANGCRPAAVVCAGRDAMHGEHSNGGHPLSPPSGERENAPRRNGYRAAPAPGERLRGVRAALGRRFPARFVRRPAPGRCWCGVWNDKPGTAGHPAVPASLIGCWVNSAIAARANEAILAFRVGKKFRLTCKHDEHRVGKTCRLKSNRHADRPVAMALSFLAMTLSLLALATDFAGEKYAGRRHAPAQR
jgi:hypothetical protein